MVMALVLCGVLLQVLIILLVIREFADLVPQQPLGTFGVSHSHIAQCLVDCVMSVLPLREQLSVFTLPGPSVLAALLLYP